MRLLSGFVALLLSSPSPFQNAVPFVARASMSSAASSSNNIDAEYPGTAVARMHAIRDRVKQLDSSSDLSGDWEDVRRKILRAGGLKDLNSAVPGQGYTGHSFNDFNHVDLTAMAAEISHSENEGRVAGIHSQNRLGAGIQIASIGEEDGLPAGGSWSTCILGCHLDPPQDVAHVQFQSRIAFKLVWVPPAFETFVLVDDAGALLNHGRPTGSLPNVQERSRNFKSVGDGKYSTAAREMASGAGGSGNGDRELKQA